MNHIFGCPMHYGVGAPGLINSLDYLQSFCPELDIDILPENYQTGREPEQSKTSEQRNCKLFTNC